MAVVIETLAAQGQTSRAPRIPLRAGTVRLNVRPGDVFRLIDEETGKAPANVTIKRQDTSILVEVAGAAPNGAEAKVELLGFYSSCSVSAPCHLNLPAESAEGTINITPATPAIGALSDGSFVLHDPSYKAAAAPGATDEGSSWTDNKPLMYGVGAAAVVGLVAAAAGGGGGGGGTAVSATPTSDATTSPVITGDGGTGTVSDPLLTVTQSSVSSKRAPILAGTGTPGSQVDLEIDTNGDSVADVSYRSTVGADGKWQADLSTLTPTTGTLPAAGLNSDSSVRVTQTNAAGTAALPVFKLTADETAPAQPTLAAVATDNIINRAEAAQPIKLSGQGEAGSLLKLNWGQRSYEATVGTDGTWSIDVPTAAIPASGTVAVSLTASDYAGNTTTPVTQSVTVDRTPPAQPVIQSTGGTDNYLNAAERAGGSSISGTAEANSTVKVSLAGQTQEVQADASGKWTAAFAAAQLPTSDGAHPVTATATDRAGNASTGSASATLTVDTKLPTLSDIEVGSDNVVRSGAAFTVTGEAEAGSRIIIDYIYTSGGARQTVTQQFTVAGQGDEAAWTSPSFTAATVNSSQTHSLLISATDPAGNVSVASHTFEVRPRLAFLLRQIETDTNPDEDSSVLSSKDLFETGAITLASNAEPSAQTSSTLPSSTAAVHNAGTTSNTTSPSTVSSGLTSLISLDEQQAQALV